MAGGILKTPAHTQVHPVQITQQQVAFAEAGFQLECHQQFTPLAFQGFPLAHLVGIERARQLLGQGAAALEHAAPEQIRDQGPGGSHRIHAGMPPETAVLTGQQGVDQHAREMAQAVELVVAQPIGGGDRFALLVVEHQGPPHRGQAAADGGLHHGEAKQQNPTGGDASEDQAAGSRQAVPLGHWPDLHIQLGQAALLAGPKAHAVAIHQQQFPHPPPLPPQTIGGPLIPQDPLLALQLEQRMVAADGAVVDLNLTIAIATDAVDPGVQGDGPHRLAGLVHHQLELAALDQPLPTPQQGLKRGDRHGPSTDQWQNRARPG